MQIFEYIHMYTHLYIYAYIFMSSLLCVCRGKNGRCNTRYIFSKISSLPDLPKNISTELIFFGEFVLLGTHVLATVAAEILKSHLAPQFTTENDVRADF